MEIAWSNGNLISGSVTSTQASAEVTRNGEDVTGEYAASAFAWKRDSGNAGADNTWNAAHAGKKAITLTAADLSGDVKISCTLTGSGATYGSITVDENMYASHTPGGLDANDVFAIANGELKVTTSRGEMYALQDGEVKGAGAKLNGTITAQSKLFASQPEDVVEFAYNHDGLRTQKKVTRADGTVETTEYTLHGKLVTHLRRGSDEMHFFYDEQSRPAMVDFNGTLYSYVHNLQGDVVGIIDEVGSLVVEYKYDAWGKPVFVRTLTTAYEDIATLNPFRYRGYIWDEESKLAYLRNRYYIPCCKRFLSSDNQFDENAGTSGYNLYAYCANDPILYADHNGRGLILACVIGFGLLGAAMGGAVAGGVARNSDDEQVAQNWGWYALGGAVLGGAVGALFGWGVGKVTAAVITVATAKAPELYASWQMAEEALRKAYNTAKTVAERTINSSLGKRIYDAFNVAKRVGYEAKYGYQSYSGNIVQQIAKDAELLANGTLNSVEWHFYTSTISNTQGYSKPLYEAMSQAGITIVKHFK